jgi:hypothetical protein
MVINQKTSCFGFVGGVHTIISRDPNDYLNYDPMPKPGQNLCTSAYDNDRELAAYTLMEKWNMYGVKLTYFQVTYNTNYDRIWGEDGDRHIIKSWDVMSYFELPKENKIWSKFGIEGVNDFSVFMSKMHFKYKTDNYIPLIGDIILSQYNDMYYEITEVKEQAPLFMLSQQYAWELIVRKMKIEQDVSVAPSLSASPITSIFKVSDIFNIDNNIDVEKEPILYKQEKGEKPQQNPFGVW